MEEGGQPAAVPPEKDAHASPHPPLHHPADQGLQELCCSPDTIDWCGSDRFGNTPIHLRKDLALPPFKNLNNAKNHLLKKGKNNEILKILEDFPLKVYLICIV